jgi:hypothetical protein
MNSQLFKQRPATPQELSESHKDREARLERERTQRLETARTKARGGSKAGGIEGEQHKAKAKGKRHKEAEEQNNE